MSGGPTPPPTPDESTTSPTFLFTPPPTLSPTTNDDPTTSPTFLTTPTPTLPPTNTNPTNGGISEPRWVEHGDANLVGASDFDKFGASSCLSANGLVLAVGAPFEILAVSAPKSNGIGYVKVYKYNGSEYEEVSNLSVSIFSGELFGYSISLSGNGRSLVVGTPKGYTTGGFVNLYYDSMGTSDFAYSEDFFGIHFPNTELGYSVSISDDGNVLAAGDSLLSEVQVHQFDGIRYQLVCTMLGEAVTLSGDGTRFAVQNQTSAIVSIYSINAAEVACLQLGQAIPITLVPSSDSYDLADMLMSLSNDGHVLAVVNSLHTNGVQVYKEKYNASGTIEYIKRGDVITIANSTSVSLLDDGKVLAVGVLFHDVGNGQIEPNGSTHVYEWPSPTIRGPLSSPAPMPTVIAQGKKFACCLLRQWYKPTHQASYFSLDPLKDLTQC
ncbi:hypothetical protein ACHAXH_001034 [Discostella pseudostelligera]